MLEILRTTNHLISSCLKFYNNENIVHELKKNSEQTQIFFEKLIVTGNTVTRLESGSYH